MKFAAIDIGSNATRLLFCNVIGEEGGEVVFKKAELIRVPLRLGEDTFIRGKIGREKADKLVTAMKAFKHLIRVYEAVDHRACATSAMRDAENRWDIVERIRREAGIKVEIIDGKTEADIIYANQIEKVLEKERTYLYIDIGGGSTEITLFAKGKVVASQSFNVGTIRMLHEQIDKEYWTYFKKWIREMCETRGPITAIGSGGNINKLYKMTSKKEDKPLLVEKLKETCAMIETYSYEDRMRVLGLNPDRADVIVPASKILLSILKQSGAEKILVPQFGLSDGIVRGLYDKHRQKNIHRLEA